MQLYKLTEQVWNLQDKQSGKEDGGQQVTPWAWSKAVKRQNFFSLFQESLTPAF